LRTVKLKDFPWNGWLQLGLQPHPSAAWNPVGGFTDRSAASCGSLSPTRR
jgi:hypothetical protein